MESIISKDLLIDYLLKHSPANIYWQDKNNVFGGCNTKQAKSAGLLTPEEIVGKTNFDLLPDSEAQKVVDVNQKVFSTGEVFEEEEYGLLGDGSEAVFLSQKIPLKDSSGDVIGLLGIAFDITDKKRIEQLQKEIEILEHTNAMMKMWATAIAHEMRTPLLALTMMANSLGGIYQKLSESNTVQESKNLKKQIEAFEPIPDKMRSTIKQAQHFVKMTLVKSRSGSIASELKLVKLNLADEITAAIEEYPFINEDKELVHLELINNFDFMGDSESFRHIIFNLLKNAIQFVKTKAGADITLKTKITDQENYLIVRDSGPGIPEEYQTELFKPFFTKSKHGTGVGLTLCKNFMEAFGGDITCESEYGEFTEFRLQFPKV